MTVFKIDKVIDIIGSSVNELQGKTILCTGTGGFLGQWVLEVVRYLNTGVFENQCRLLAYDMRIPSENVLQSYRDSGIEFFGHDLTTKLWPMAEKVDYVIHMAGIASPYHYKKRPLETIDVAIEGARSALEIARHHGAKFLFTSSSEVYQTASVIPTPETYVGAIASNNERSCYDVSKLMAENLSYVYHHNFGVNTRCVRIFNSFGPGIAETDSRILPRIASSVVGGYPLTVYAHNPLPTRTYCPTGNTIGGIFLALLNGKSGEIYNVGVDHPEVSVVELISIAEKIVGKRIEFDLVAPDSVYSDEPMRRCPDISKARNELGYNPIISLEEGLNSFFDWALLNYNGRRDI